MVDRMRQDVLWCSSTGCIVRWGIVFFIITLLIHNWVHNCVYMLAGQYGV